MHIYKTTNIINGKIYVGQHIGMNKNYLGSGNVIKQAIKKYGKYNFIKEIIEDNIENEDVLNEREIYWIKKLNATNPEIGYNRSIGGEGNTNPSKETRKKLSLALQGHFVTSETKKKLSGSHKGKPSSFKGRKHSEAAKLMIGEKSKGRCSGSKNKWYGTHLTPEIREKMSKNHADISGEKNYFFNKHLSEEAKEKMRMSKRRTEMEFKELFPLQVVINLDSRKDRLEICQKEEFPKIKINPLRKSGVVFKGTNNDWWNGAIGCMISHYHVLQSALLLNTNVFIFEDDVSFIDEKIRKNLGIVCEQIKKLDWDMLYIGGNILKPAYQVSSHLAKLTHAQSTSSYGVNIKFIEKLLKYFDLSNIMKPIDLIYAEDVIPNHNCYISIPMLAIQRSDYSNIEQKIMTYDIPIERYNNFLRKEGNF